jgi:hypothetical protein
MSNNQLELPFDIVIMNKESNSPSGSDWWISIQMFIILVQIFF